MDKQKYRHYIHLNDINGKKLDIKEKKHLVFLYMVSYRKAIIELNYEDVLKNNNEENRKEKNVHYIEYINRILESLSVESKNYIVNEYINNFNNPSWWTKTYNKSTFYKVRENALNEFLLYVS